MVKRLSVMLISLLVLGWSAAYAAGKPKMTAAEFEASLKYQKGIYEGIYGVWLPSR